MHYHYGSYMYPAHAEGPQAIVTAQVDEKYLAVFCPNGNTWVSAVKDIDWTKVPAVLAARVQGASLSEPWPMRDEDRAEIFKHVIRSTPRTSFSRYSGR